jgi:hypothetical protein
MLIMGDKKDSLVNGRAIGKVKRYGNEYDQEQSRSSESNLPGVTSFRELSSCPSLILNLASNGKAYSNNNPIEAVKKII